MVINSNPVTLQQIWSQMEVLGGLRLERRLRPSIFNGRDFKDGLRRFYGEMAGNRGRNGGLRPLRQGVGGKGDEAHVHGTCSARERRRCPNDGGERDGLQEEEEVQDDWQILREDGHGGKMGPMGVSRCPGTET
ncbi:hypothetical protein E4U52_005246 [Claviceps spartinae]|nr:hypothetical protein E4U52_005246 [Claviceps spartinae]